MKPGIYNLTDEQYHADALVDQPSLSASIIKTMLAKSPLHAWAEHPRLNPNYKPDDDTKLDIGTAAHALLLQGMDTMEVLDFPDFRTKAAREARDDAREAGKTPILADDAKRIRDMVEVAQEAMSTCSELGCTIETCVAEQTIIWQEDGGVWCRAKPDLIANDYSVIPDYKTTSGSASPDQVQRSIIQQMGGIVQGAFYVRALKNLFGNDAKFVFMVQEDEFPYAVSFVGLPPAYMGLGEDMILHAIKIWRECLRTNKWPGYGNRIYWAEPKPWTIDDWVSKSEMQQANYEYGEQA